MEKKKRERGDYIKRYRERKKAEGIKMRTFLLSQEMYEKVKEFIRGLKKCSTD